MSAPAYIRFASATAAPLQVREFRSRQLVGLAAMDLNQRDLILCQHGDNQTYAATAMWVHHFLPREVTFMIR